VDEENVNRPVIIKNLKFVIKFFKRKASADNFTGAMLQLFKG
jgi:hypothetical protein